MRLLLIVAAATVSLLLLGCRTERNTPTHAATVKADALQVTRSNPLHQPVPVLSPLTISDPAFVNHLYSLLVSMPPFPKGPMSCPGDYGVRYHLVFLDHGQTVLSADADPSGCEGVKLSDGRILWAYPSSGSGPQFWSLFAEAVHLTLSQVKGVPDTASRA